MKSGWKVSTNYCSDLRLYQVYRLRDTNKPDEGGNREYKDKVYYNKDEAKKAANEANKEECETFWKERE